MLAKPFASPLTTPKIPAFFIAASDVTIPVRITGKEPIELIIFVIVFKRLVSESVASLTNSVSRNSKEKDCPAALSCAIFASRLFNHFSCSLIALFSALFAASNAFCT